jgi:S1-C subfamily serine protease
VTLLDWVVVGLAAVFALLGAQEGFVAGILSLAGLVLGAIGGGRLADAFLARGGHSPYAPLVAVAGAVILALLIQSIGLRVGLFLSSGLFRVPPLRSLDAIGGLLLGGACALVLAWALGVVALQLPGQTKLRREVQRSSILRRLNRILPPSTVLRALARFDPFPSITGPQAQVPAPDPRVLRLPGVRAAAPSIVRVVGTACGLGIEGSGWVAAPEMVVTAAHVVAGERDTAVRRSGSRTSLAGRVVAFDPHDDVAVLRVPGLGARPLRLVDPRPGRAVAILGYPLDGPFDAVPGRIGATRLVITQDAYGRPTARAVTTVRGTVRHGNSGGPAVDASGTVQTTVFATRVGGGAGFGVPSSAVRETLARARGSVSTGPCVR